MLQTFERSEGRVSPILLDALSVLLAAMRHESRIVRGRLLASRAA